MKISRIYIYFRSPISIIRYSKDGGIIVPRRLRKVILGMVGKGK